MGEKGKKLFIIWIAVAAVFLVGSYAAFLGIMSRPHEHPAPTPPPLNKVGQGGGEAVEDPVCGMNVKPPAAGHAAYKGKTYYFCSTACKEDFKKEPGKYIHRRDAEGAKKKE